MSISHFTVTRNAKTRLFLEILAILMVLTGCRPSIAVESTKAEPPSESTSKTIEQDAEKCIALKLQGKKVSQYLEEKVAHQLPKWEEWASRGLPEAQYLLALCAKVGQGIEKSPARAARLFQTAAGAGYAPALVELGLCYEYGEGVPRDEVKAAECYRTATDQGFAIGEKCLGACYQSGVGVDTDKDEAFRLFFSAAEQGYPQAQLAVGYAYANGHGVVKDEWKAVRWYEAAANQSYPAGQRALGQAYFDGIGVPKDQERGFRLTKAAAEAGDLDAMANLAICYELGEGTQKNLTEALSWYKTAAEQGHSQAQYNYGACFNNGDLVEKDWIEAVRWYRRAADQGHEAAKRAIKSKKQAIQMALGKAELMAKMRSSRSGAQESHLGVLIGMAAGTYDRPIDRAVEMRSEQQRLLSRLDLSRRPRWQTELATFVIPLAEITYGSDSEEYRKAFERSRKLLGRKYLKFEDDPVWPFDNEEAKRRQQVAAKSLDQPVVFTNGLGMKLCLIPAGEFVMGNPGPSCEDQHRVWLTRHYYLGMHEVTQGQYQELMGETPWVGEKNVEVGADYPAVYVTWEDAKQFCSRLCLREGRQYRLPTEAEWEYACRAGSADRFYFGSGKFLEEHAWTRYETRDANAPYAQAVGKKKSNPFGLHDVFGNVDEWCYDWYDEDYYKQSPIENPRGPSARTARVLRGGSWYDGFRLAHQRDHMLPAQGSFGAGFRVVLVP